MKGWKEVRRLPRRVWVIAAATLVNRLGTMALPFLTLYLTSAKSWPVSRAALILGLFGGAALVMGPVGGKLADRFGPVTMAKLTLVGTGLCIFFFPLARSVVEVAAMTVLWAACYASFRPANLTALVECVTPEQRKPAIALLRAAANLGMSVGPAAGGFIAARSYIWLWRVDGLSCLLASVVLWRWLGVDSPRPAPPAEAVPSGGGWTDPRLLWFLAALLPVNMVFFQLQSSLPLFLVRDLGARPDFYGLLFTVNTLLIVAVEIPLNQATAHWPFRRTLALGALLIGVGFGAHALASREWHIVLFTVVWTFGEMILMPCTSAYVAAVAPEGRRGEYLGLQGMGLNLAFMLGPWIGALALERLGARTLWLGCLLLGGASAVLLSRVAGAEEALEPAAAEAPAAL